MGDAEEFRRQRHELTLVRAILAKDPKARSTEDIDKLVKFLPTLAFFEQLEGDIPPSLLSTICSALHYQLVPEMRTPLYYQDQDFRESNFYIRMSGTIVVDADTDYEFDKNSFGEEYLSFALPPGTRLVNRDEVELLVLTREDYDKLLRGIHERELNARVEFLQDLQVPIFRSYSRSELYALAIELVPVVVAADKVIVKEGNVGEEMFFVRRGECTAFKEVFIYEEPTRVSMHEERKKVKKLLEVGTLMPGEFFGENVLLQPSTPSNKPKRQASVCSRTEVELLLLSRVDFVRTVTGTALRRLAEYAAGYPSESQLVDWISQRQGWRKFKRDVVKQYVDPRILTKTS